MVDLHDLGGTECPDRLAASRGPDGRREGISLRIVRRRWRQLH
jgi:hypothetical protein